MKLVFVMFLMAAPLAADVARSNVVWDTPSADSSGSMPLGNGETGLNVWVEKDGDLLFYLARTDAWSDAARLLKLGRVRVHFTPNPFRAGQPFRQTLHLERGEIEIEAGGDTIVVRADANRPGLVRIDIASPRGVAARAELEAWRVADRVLFGEEQYSAYGMDGGPNPIVERADTVIREKSGDVLFYHRNEHSIWPETMRLQGLAGLIPRLRDPLLHRTFGGLVLNPRPGRHRRLQISILTHTAQTATLLEWTRRLRAEATALRRQDPKAMDDAHRRWWREFWERSWVRVSGAPAAETVSRGYALQRFIAACAGRGAFPIKFNGSLFTVDAKIGNARYDADYRRWGGPYWFQNTRLPYWPMLASGDFDLMQPFFRMYLDALPLASARTPLYFQHSGAFFPETMYFWGAYANSNYGWNREGHPASYVENRYIRYYWSGALELIALAVDHWEHTRDERFRDEVLLPLAGPLLEFFDKHYVRRGGKLHFEPAQALETWWDSVDPLPEIAGLRWVLDRLPPRPEWQRLRRELPELPMRGGALLPARHVPAKASNSENPELYAVFPYRLYGLGKPNLDVGRRTFERRAVKRTGGWTPDAIQAAMLGLTAIARDDVVLNFQQSDPGSRFPAFWGPNFDWIPDQDHGSVAVMALQTMLLQADHGKIRLLPAWPKEWDVEFRLHAPERTVVEGEYRGGKLVRLEVTPASRRGDVVLP